MMAAADPTEADGRPSMHQQHSQLSESVSSTLDEIVYERTSCKSDPIGREHDLGSGGPLDEGVEPYPGSIRIPQSEQTNRVRPRTFQYSSNPSPMYDTPSRTCKDPSLAAADIAARGRQVDSSPIASSMVNGNFDTGSPIKKKLFFRNGEKTAANVQMNSNSWQINGHHRNETPAVVEGHGMIANNDASGPCSAVARRNARSHTSQGIPNHNLRMLLAKSESIVEEGVSAGSGFDDEEVEKLKEEVLLYRSRIAVLEEQIALLLLQNEEALAALNSTDAASQLRNTLETWATGLALSPNTALGSTPSLTTSPDAFSPYLSTTPSAPQYAFYKPQAPNFGMPMHHIGGHQNPLGIPKETTGSENPYLMTGLRLNLANLSASNPQSPISNENNGDGGEEKALHPLFASPSFYDAKQRSTQVQSTRTSADNEANTYGNNLSNANDDQIPPDLLVSRAMSARNQEASITLQQQLKTAHPARKAAIVRAIEPHVLKLADDKHGNFLVQRAIGVDPQLALRLKGHFVQLSLSQFGCHVVQRLLDEEEGLRKMVVDELLSSNVHETLVCRNSIHIWQKVLELHWSPTSDVRARIYGVVNRTMKGKWADVAMLETGSIICQNIFESATPDEKRDCLVEVLKRLCECACNQWGVWVVQHIIEHGESDVKRAAFNRLLEGAGRLTLSQYGQKAIMSALKSRDAEFVARYIDILCDRDASSDAHGAHNLTIASSSGNRRSLLVDVSTAPQGVQIVTQLLTSVTPEQRERIIKTVRKNSVFLKGSKAGLRVHQLCGAYYDDVEETPLLIALPLQNTERARAFTGY